MRRAQEVQKPRRHRPVHRSPHIQPDEESNSIPATGRDPFTSREPNPAMIRDSAADGRSIEASGTSERLGNIRNQAGPDSFPHPHSTLLPTFLAALVSFSEPAQCLDYYENEVRPYLACLPSRLGPMLPETSLSPRQWTFVAAVLHDIMTVVLSGSSLKDDLRLAASGTCGAARTLGEFVLTRGWLQKQSNSRHDLLSFVLGDLEPVIWSLFREESTPEAGSGAQLWIDQASGIDHKCL
ncbi:hypothetical protein B0H14DRAFT_3129923 [Mycena olivaceomarginata]|nr:hypothetical protein B0H14DRAFT_3129923 [Mycena olivaceomarginata]